METVEINNKKDYSVSMLKANLYALIMTAPFIILLTVLYWAVWGYEHIVNALVIAWDQPGTIFKAYLIFLVIFVVGVVIHELIHGITWVIAAKKPWSQIKFGFQVKTFTPYCHIKEPIPIAPYRLGAVMPGIITGFLPAFVAILIGNIWLFLIGLLFVFAAGGDLLILWLVRKVENSALVEDHPTRAGCYVLTGPGSL